MRLRRKSRSEREQERLEEAELARRMRAGEPVSLAGNMTAAPALRVAKQVYGEGLRSANLPDATGVEPFVCEKHEWRPALMPGQPPPPRSECPKCKAEAEARYGRGRAGEGSRTIIVSSPSQVRDTGAVARAGDRHEQRLQERGQVLPGSIEEAIALDRIEELREQEQEREQRRYPAVAWESFDGSRRIYHKPWNRNRRASSYHLRDGSVTVEA